MHKQYEYTVLRLIKWNHIKHSVLKFAFSFKIFHVYMRFHFILLCPRKNNYDLGLYNCQTESKLIWFNGLLWKLLRFLWLNSLQTLNPCCVSHTGDTWMKPSLRWILLEQVNKWLRSPTGQVSAEHNEEAERGGRWLCGRVNLGGGSCGWIHLKWRVKDWSGIRQGHKQGCARGYWEVHRKATHWETEPLSSVMWPSSWHNYEKYKHQ